MNNRWIHACLAPWLALACLIGVACLPAVLRGEYIWMEAEAMEQEHFPPLADNPFRAQAFWESDALSGGEWVGMRWDDPSVQPMLRHAFEVRVPGSYRLYVRKFYRYGNFRWRIDEGPWQEVSDEAHISLDWTPMREDRERIALNWFNMGSVRLDAGTHLLEVEPVYRELDKPQDVGHPLGYDVFVFTDSLLFPKGKLKPGETYNPQKPNAFAFEPPVDDFAPSAMDWRELNEVFAGAHGGLTIREGELVQRDTLQPYRLCGVTLPVEMCNDSEGIRYLARFLAKRGFNLVRFELSSLATFASGADGDVTAQTRPDSLRHLMDAVDAFKAQGIYTALTWDIPRSPGFSDALYAGEAPQQDGDYALAIQSREDVRRAVKTVWRAVLKARLPSTQEPLSGDPCLAMLTLMQQSSVFDFAMLVGEALDARTKASVHRQYTTWLEANYGSAELAKEAWQSGGNGTPEQVSVTLLSAPQSLQVGRAQARDNTAFLVDLQTRFAESLIRWMRDELGYTGIISVSNKAAVNAPEHGYASALSLLPGDVIERHANFRAPFVSQSDPWVIAQGVRYRDRSAILFDPLPGQEATAIDLPLRMPRHENKPNFLTEINWPEPNAYRSEALLLTTFLASMQQVPVIGLNVLDSYHWRNFTAGARTPVFTPAIMGQTPAFFYAYRKGFMPAGVPVLRLALSEDSIMVADELPIHEVPDTQLDVPIVPVTPDTASTGQVPPGLWMHGPVDITYGEETIEVEVLHEVAEGGGGSFVFADGDARWNYEEGYLRIDTPMFASIGGFLSRQERFIFGNLSIDSNMPFGVIALVALDDRPLDQSQRMLLQVFSTEEAYDRYAEPEAGMERVRSIGRPPIMVSHLSGTIRFHRPDADRLVATALDANGYPVLQVAAGDTLQLVPTTLYYLIEVR